MLYSHNGSYLNNNDSVALVAEMIRPGSRVLDVGCGDRRLWGVCSKKRIAGYGALNMKPRMLPQANKSEHMRKFTDGI